MRRQRLSGQEPDHHANRGWFPAGTVVLSVIVLLSICSYIRQAPSTDDAPYSADPVLPSLLKRLFPHKYGSSIVNWSEMLKQLTGSMKNSIPSSGVLRKTLLLVGILTLLLLLWSRFSRHTNRHSFPRRSYLSPDLDTVQPVGPTRGRPAYVRRLACP